MDLSPAAIVVGVVFVVAGGSKLAAGEEWPAQGKGLGAPDFVVPFVPWAELAVGAALIAGLAEPVPEIVALAMLVAFTVAIVGKLRQGEHPPCACFGAWSAKPIGPWHLVRNSCLIVLTVVAMY